MQVSLHLVHDYQLVAEFMLEKVGVPRFELPGLAKKHQFLEKFVLGRLFVPPIFSFVWRGLLGFWVDGFDEVIRPNSALVRKDLIHESLLGGHPNESLLLYLLSILDLLGMPLSTSFFLHRVFGLHVLYQFVRRQIQGLVLWSLRFGGGCLVCQLRIQLQVYVMECSLRVRLIHGEVSASDHHLVLWEESLMWLVFGSRRNVQGLPIYSPSIVHAHGG